MLTMVTRLPLDPLAHELGITLGQHGGQRRNVAENIGSGTITGLAALANLLGVTDRTLRRWRTQGLTPDQADRYANALGKHPAWIWGDAWYDTDADLDGHAHEPCRCGPHQRPLGRICDRCGHDRPRNDVRPITDTG